MAKGAELKTSGKVGKTTVMGIGIGAPPRLSPEEADRAAAAFVPIWQLDDAPFAAGAEIAAEDLHALASPVALKLAPPPTFGPALSPMPPEVSPAALATADEASADAVDPMMSRATVKMTPPVVLHQPAPEHQADQGLPSIIVDGVEVVPEAPPAVAAAPAVALPPAPIVAVEPPAPLREPKTDPPKARPRPPRPVAEAEAVTGSDYEVPRSKLPVIVGVILAGCAILAIVAYFMKPTTQPAPTAGSVGAPTTPTHTTPAEPATAIPPPPPVDEVPAPRAAPPTTPAATTPPVAVAPSSPPPPAAAPPRSDVRPPPASAPKAASPPPQPRAPRPSPPKKPSATPASGGIVRDNPF